MADKNIPDYPSNSHKAREQETPALPEKRVDKVITGGVKKAKKGVLNTALKLFIAEDVTDVKSHIVHNIVIPTLKRMASDAFDYFLNGETGKRRPTTKSYTNYSGSYRSDDRDRHERYVVRDAYEIDDIVLDSRGDAEMVLDELCELIERYGKATVADLYDAIGTTAQHTDYNYGWTSLRTASIVRVRDGYLLKFPRISPFER